MKSRAAKILALPALLAILAIAGALTLMPKTAAQTTNDAVESATGHGSYSVGVKQNRQFSFSAVRHADGTVTGNAIIQNPAFNFRGQLEISCLRVTPNAVNPVTGEIGTRADIGGTLRNTNDPTLEGQKGFFTVFDNGEPGQGRDTISPVFFDTAVGPEACQNILGDTTAPSNAVQLVITAGNIQVRAAQ